MPPAPPPITPPNNRQQTPKPLFKPAVILHGGAGNIQRSRLRPDLYNQYRTSLLTYLRSTTAQLNANLDDAPNNNEPDDHFDNTRADTNINPLHTSPASALNAAVHAVSLMEDDELFNCGRGSVFTSAGTIEMEASVMVASLLDNLDEGGTAAPGSVKRGAGVMMIRNVRHPIRLAREVLMRTGRGEGGAGDGDGDGDGGNMHCQLSGSYVEGLAGKWGLERCPDEWFWTRKRWEEHRRGLEGGKKGVERERGVGTGMRVGEYVEEMEGMAGDGKRDIESRRLDELLYLSQGTVGCVCLDRWGNIAVATSTGGLTNKCPGRIGDTPTLGAGFWAEAWDIICSPTDGIIEGNTTGDTKLHAQPYHTSKQQMLYQSQEPTPIPAPFPWDPSPHPAYGMFRQCISPPSRSPRPGPPPQHQYPPEKQPMITDATTRESASPSRLRPNRRRRVLALSGTGNGDSFLRTAATRTAAAMARFSPSNKPLSLSDVVTAVAGPGGELERSAGPRWGTTGEGQGGIIGIEAEVEVDDDDDGIKGENRGYLRRGNVVFDFNCGGMFRAWMEDGGEGGEDVERVMVFREEYE
ncbi:hypothetical protein FQN50_008764 [Emmonsiellopsis sp. PD_5]|nr:hypothetical protein FQN50_008764 [Emmonsiellopsis sp. PD_5]